MQQQIQITEKTKLLDHNGFVKSPGYCVRNLFEYDRKDITANKARIKEWDYYQISDGHYLVQIVIANISLATAGYLAIIDMYTGKRTICTNLDVLTLDRLHLPKNGDEPHTLENKRGKFFSLKYDVTETCRHITFEGYCVLPFPQKVKADLKFEKNKDLESITIVTPFAKGKRNRDHFFLTQKQNSMPVSGGITIGKKHISFNPNKAYGVLDWGRGVWVYDSRWVWANGTTRLPNGKLFGFEVTSGFGDESFATETCLFYDGKAHKIGRVNIEYQKGNRMIPWKVTEENGRFEMTVTPFFDNKAQAMFGVAGSVCHQVHGKWSGTATLDDGTVLEINDMDAFCEHVHNRW